MKTMSNDSSLSEWGAFSRNVLSGFANVAAANLSKQTQDAAEKNRPQEIADDRKTWWIIGAIAAGVVALVLIIRR